MAIIRSEKPNFMIEIENLTKSFNRKKKKSKLGKITAVGHVNLTIKKGEIFGLIGPNGAGKTTMLKILSTLIIPDEGTATIDGFNVVKDVDAVKTRIGLLAGEFVRSFYWRLSGRQNLKFFANLRGMWHPDGRISELIELFNLKNHEDELVMKYSTGMKHKLALATGLLHDPPVLFLDEPLTGIDPVTTYEIKDLIKNEFKDKTIIWASHNLYEVEEMCDRIALFNHGKVVLKGTPDSLKKDCWDHIKVMVTSDKPYAFSSLQNAEIKDNVVEIKAYDVKKTFLTIAEIVQEKNVEILNIQTLKPTLEEIFRKGIEND